MTPREVVADLEEVKVTLQALAGRKVGWGMDNLFQSFLRVAFKFVKATQELARHVDALSVSVAKKSDESNP